MTSRPRAIVFDWDNTLVDTWRIIHRALESTFRAMDQEPWTLAETRQRVRRSAREAFPELFGDRSDEALRIFYETFEAEHLSHLRALDGAEVLLPALTEAGILLAVVSNKEGRIMRREAEHLGWSRYFHRLVGGSDAARDKPAPEAVELALAGSGVSAGRDVWFVGDTDIDMLCAAQSGCVSVLLRETPPEGAEFGDFPPEFHVSGCLALAELAKAP